VGYNPINGESYATKDGLNSKVETIENEKESDETNKTCEEDNAVQVDNEQKKEESNGDVHTSTELSENGKSDTPVEKPTNGHSTVKVNSIINYDIQLFFMYLNRLRIQMVEYVIHLVVDPMVHFGKYRSDIFIIGEQTYS
jgi:hypothetical protein